jgi:hypothetical protein
LLIGWFDLTVPAQGQGRQGSARSALTRTAGEAAGKSALGTPTMTTPEPVWWLYDENRTLNDIVSALLIETDRPGLNMTRGSATVEYVHELLFAISAPLFSSSPNSLLAIAVSAR